MRETLTDRVREVLAPGSTDPERAFADGQVGWHAVRLEPLRDLLRLRVDPGDGLALVVEDPHRPLAHGDVAGGRGRVDEGADIAARRIERGDPVAGRLRAARRRRPSWRRSASRPRPARKSPPATIAGARVQRLGTPDGEPRCRHLEAERGGGCLDQLAAGRVTVLPVLRQRLAHHRVEPPRAAQRGGSLLHVRPHRRRLGVAPERRLPGQALVEHAGERVAVGAASTGSPRICSGAR